VFLEAAKSILLVVSALFPIVTRSAVLGFPLLTLNYDRTLDGCSPAASR